MIFSKLQTVFWFGLDKCQVPTKTALPLPLLSWKGEKKYDERLEGQDKDWERSLTNCCHRQNRLNTGRKGSLIHNQSNQSTIARKLILILKHFPTHTFLLPGLNFTPVSLPPTPERHRGTGNGGYGQFIACCLCCSLSLGRGLLTHCPGSSVRSLSQETVLHKLLQCDSFPWAAALCKLPQCGSLPQGAVLQKQAAPAWVPHGVTSPASKPAPVWAPLSTGPGRGLFQHGVPMGSQPPSGIHLLRHGVPSMGYRWSSAPPWTSKDCRGTACLTMVCITSCKGGLSALSSGAPPPPSFFTDLGVCRAVSLTSSHSSLTAIS